MVGDHRDMKSMYWRVETVGRLRTTDLVSLYSEIRPEISWDMTLFYLTLSIKLTPIPRYNFRVKNWTQLKNIPMKGNRGIGDVAQLVDWAAWHMRSPRFKNQQCPTPMLPHTRKKRIRNLESSWATCRVLFKGSVSYLKSGSHLFFNCVVRKFVSAID